jgi:hypothetical protein
MPSQLECDNAIVVTTRTLGPWSRLRSLLGIVDCWSVIKRPVLQQVARIGAWDGVWDGSAIGMRWSFALLNRLRRITR